MIYDKDSGNRYFLSVPNLSSTGTPADENRCDMFPCPYNRESSGEDWSSVMVTHTTVSPNCGEVREPCEAQEDGR